MTKADIIDTIHDRTNFTMKDSAKMIEAAFSIIKDTLEAGGPLKITGFGNFEVKKKADRKGRNPQTGEGITIEARKVVTFKLSSVLRNTLNGKAA